MVELAFGLDARSVSASLLQVVPSQLVLSLDEVLELVRVVLHHPLEHACRPIRFLGSQQYPTFESYRSWLVHEHRASLGLDPSASMLEPDRRWIASISVAFLRVYRSVEGLRILVLGSAIQPLNCQSLLESVM